MTKNKKGYLAVSIVLLTVIAIFGTRWGLFLYDHKEPTATILIVMSIWYILCIALSFITYLYKPRGRPRRAKERLLYRHETATWFIAILVGVCGLYRLRNIENAYHVKILFIFSIGLFLYFSRNIYKQTHDDSENQVLNVKDVKERLRQFSAMQMFALIFYLFLFTMVASSVKQTDNTNFTTAHTTKELQQWLNLFAQFRTILPSSGRVQPQHLPNFMMSIASVKKPIS